MCESNVRFVSGWALQQMHEMDPLLRLLNGLIIINATPSEVRTSGWCAVSEFYRHLLRFVAAAAHQQFLSCCFRTADSIKQLYFYTLADWHQKIAAGVWATPLTSFNMWFYWKQCPKVGVQGSCQADIHYTTAGRLIHTVAFSVCLHDSSPLSV